MLVALAIVSDTIDSNYCGFVVVLFITSHELLSCIVFCTYILFSCMDLASDQQFSKRVCRGPQYILQ